MPASTVVSAPSAAPARSAARANPSADARESGAVERPFGRQLDAARQRHASSADHGNGADPARPAGAAPDAASTTEVLDSTAAVAAGGVAAAAGAGSLDAGTTDAASAPADQADDTHTDADDGSAAQLIIGLLAPALVAGLPASASAGTTQHGRPAVLVAGGIAGAAAAAAGASISSDASAAGAALVTDATATGGSGKGPLDQAWLLDPRTRAADDGQTGAPTVAGLAPASSAPASASVPLLPVAAPVGTPEFGPELGRQVLWVSGQDIKQARLRLHPEELGQVDLKVSVTHGRVDVLFSAQHPGAVQALQQSLPQLDQMLAQQGLSLGHAEVGQHGRDDSPPSRQRSDGPHADRIDDIHAVSTTAAVRALNLLDAFA